MAASPSFDAVSPGCGELLLMHLPVTPVPALKLALLRTGSLNSSPFSLLAVVM
jgi:hypothetical protein